jgi:hypothetical protein
MRIESTTFGAITIDRKTYEHDVVIRLSGEVVKRKTKLSKKLYGTSHVLSKDEVKFLFDVVALDGDVKNSTGVGAFAARYPGRFFESFVPSRT